MIFSTFVENSSTVSALYKKTENTITEVRSRDLSHIPLIFFPISIFEIEDLFYM